HGRAGSITVYEVHGHVRETTCMQCFREYPGLERLAQFIDDGAVPHCTACGGVLKPNVILFGEQLPAQVMNAAEQAARNCDLMLVAGSSLETYPVADLPARARSRGARLIIVNRETTPLDALADVVIHADVAEALPAIAAAVLDG
ncbi:MAG: NAD-dependent deacetylase, partial [Anaerolineales bacterium]